MIGSLITRLRRQHAGGSFRCDANVSVADLADRLAALRDQESQLFRFMERAIEFEAKRQIDILEDGGKIAQ